MKLTILVDNNTFIDQYYHGEPAASFYIETEDKKILFDTGYSDILISNAEKMSVDLELIYTNETLSVIENTSDLEHLSICIRYYLYLLLF